ncbi:MAG: ZIP family metal transporter [Eggerthellaceae bacterium]|nr:ZIP family metal transporter [Eggerthellaceae bacterium]
MLYITMVTLIAGVGGTGLGGIIGALFRMESHRTISLLLSFAGGVMLAIVCFDLLIEAVNAAHTFGNYAIPLVVAAVVVGVGTVYGLNFIIDHKTRPQVAHVNTDEHPRTHDDIDELIHADHLAHHRKHHDPKPALFVAGVVMALAIALHNVPEGMTIGAAYAVQGNLLLGSGMVLAILIGLHNIPEGMAVSVPLISGGMKRSKAILMTALSGAPTILGAWVGYLLGDIGQFGLTASLGFASGAMLYIVFGEIIPQSVLMYRSKLPAFFVIIGVLLGLCIIYL